MLFFLLLFSKLFSSPLEEGLARLEDQPEGYSIVHEVFCREDLDFFDCIDIAKKDFFHHFGTASDSKEELEKFFLKIGNNSKEIAEKAAEKINTMMEDLLSLSKREVACFHLSAFIPTTDFDIPRWHMDGLYFRCPRGYLSYKVALTLKGPSTLFYPADSTLRNIVQNNYADREYLSTVFPLSQAVIPQRGEAVFFIGSNWKKSAIHSEPVTHENRLFFSMIPCSQKQLSELKPKILKIYEALSRPRPI